MSRDSLDKIVQKAINDSAFRAKLASNPLDAITGFDLDDEERALFEAAKGKDFNELLMKLEPRVSKSISIPKPTSNP